LIIHKTLSRGNDESRGKRAEGSASIFIFCGRAYDHGPLRGESDWFPFWLRPQRNHEVSIGYGYLLPIFENPVVREWKSRDGYFGQAPCRRGTLEEERAVIWCILVTGCSFAVQILSVSASPSGLLPRLAGIYQ
jgi:hypothetical protein